MRAASSSAWCGRATRPISASASPARSIARIVNVGDRVHAGDVVARLDPQDLELQVASAQAELAAATSNLAQTPPPMRRATPTSRPAAPSRSPTTIARRPPRTRPKDGSSAPGARSILPRNQLAYARAQGRRRRRDHRDARRARPGRGARPGRWRGSRTTARWKRVVALPETWLGEARAAERHRAAVVAIRDRSFAAHLRELSPQADATTRTYAARFTIENPDDTVALGMTATVTLSHASERRSRSCRSPPSSTAAPAHPSIVVGRSRRARAAAGDGRRLHRGRRRSSRSGVARRRQRRHARRAEARSRASRSAPSKPVDRPAVDHAQREGRSMKRFNLSRMGDHAPGARPVHDPGARRRRRLFLPQPRPRRGSLLHHQDHGGERRLAGRDRDRDADPGRRQDREEAAGAALSRPRRKLFAARRILHPGVS